MTPPRHTLTLIFVFLPGVVATLLKPPTAYTALPILCRSGGGVGGRGRTGLLAARRGGLAGVVSWGEVR